MRKQRNKGEIAIQTFLPYADYQKTAEVLDYKRLGKQRVEVLQIARCIASGRTTGGWVNHPAVRMWRGHLENLVEYGLVICRTWKARGYKDTCEEKLLEIAEPNLIVPEWMGDERVHKSHRSKLLSKLPEHYREHFDDPEDLEYFWPV